MLEKLTIKNFKSIQNAEVCFGRFNAIVGLNAAGKTNLLSALSLLRNLVIGRDMEKSYGQFSLLPRELLNRSASSNQFSISAVVSHADEQRYMLEIVFELSSLDEETLPRLVIDFEKLTKISGEKGQEIIYERRKGKLFNSEGKQIPLDVEQTRLAISLYVDANARAARNIFGQMFITDNSMIDMRESIVTQKSTSLGGLLIRLKNDNKETFEQFQKVVHKLVPSFSSFVDNDLSEDDLKEVANSESLREYIVLFKENNLSGNLSIKALSTGDVRTLYVIAAIFSLSPYSVLVLEEIENGIHPKRIVDVMDHLDTISRSKNIQVICTTHSPKVINALRPVDVVFATKKDEGGTTFVSLKDSSSITQIQAMLNEGGELTDYINSGI